MKFILTEVGSFLNSHVGSHISHGMLMLIWRGVRANCQVYIWTETSQKLIFDTSCLFWALCLSAGVISVSWIWDLVKRRRGKRKKNLKKSYDFFFCSFSSQFLECLCAWKAQDWFGVSVVWSSEELFYFHINGKVYINLGTKHSLF